MYADHCSLKGKRGIATLERSGAYAVITNRSLYDRRIAHKFTIVNTEHPWVDSVYPDPREARSALKTLGSPS
jgi:hypothetical protein